MTRCQRALLGAWTVVVLISLLGCATKPAQLATATEVNPSPSEPRQRARVRLELAAAYLEHGQAAVALTEVGQALQIDPQWDAAHHLHGLVLLQLKQTQLAQASFEHALRLQPSNGDVWHNLGWLHCEAGRYAAAQAAFDQALQTPLYLAAGRTWLTVGLCQQRAGQIDEARLSLQRALESTPTHPIALFNLALLSRQGGDSAQARRYLRELNQTPAANAESLALGAEIEMELLNPLAAQQLQAQLASRFPDSREAICLATRNCP